ncbi:hypothetical protein, partial [Winogradskyella sp.]|uniref:hypothetical protein n=1 Tax=Winogradskyella sp. TaxID=1883156 RepID=UPI002613C6E1
MPKKKIINAHAHVFTSQFVPPFLARTIIIWPLFYFINTRHIVALAKRYYSWKNGLKFPKKNDDTSWDKIYGRRRRKRFWSLFGFNFRSFKLIYYPYLVIVFWLSLVAVLYTINILASIFGLDDNSLNVIRWIKEKLSTYHLYYELNIWLKLLWIAFVVVFINWSRRAIWFVIKGLFPIFNKIVSAKGMELLERYLLMGRFAMYGSQQKVAERALHQLPPGSDMVILPMDMEEMGAGKTKLSAKTLKTKAEKIKDKGWAEDDFKDTYKYQMRELWEFVESRRNSGSDEQYHPFLFLDPRRIAKEGSNFFDYEIEDGRMKLKPCFVKTYM